MLDAGRNFLSTAVIKRLIVGMAMLKMNVLHWHMTDDQSFPVSTRAFPQLAQKTTFAPTAHYNSNDCPSLFSLSDLSVVCPVSDSLCSALNHSARDRIICCGETLMFVHILAHSCTAGELLSFFLSPARDYAHCVGAAV